MAKYDIPPGVHLARPCSIAYAESSAKQTPKFEIEFVLEGGPFDGEPMRYDGWLTDGAVAMTMRALAACGADVARSMRELLEEVEQSGTIAGFGSRPVNLVVVSEYSPILGDDMTRVRFVNPAGTADAGGTSGRSRALAILEKFAAAKKAKIGGAGGESGAPTSP